MSNTENQSNVCATNKYETIGIFRKIYGMFNRNRY